MHTKFHLDDCFAVRQAARQISQFYDRHLSKAGVTPTQFTILTAISLKPKQTMQQLARVLVMERTTVLRALRPLLRSGYLRSMSVDAPRRQLVFEVSATGAVKLVEATIHWRAAQKEFEARFGPAEASRLRSELLRIAVDFSCDG